jgi:hypothetical protein
MKSRVKRVVKALLGEGLVGAVEYAVTPGLGNCLSGPFNGQRFRQRMFREILEAIPFAAIIETGTFRGTTTEFMRALSPLPIHTVELHPRYYAFARARFKTDKDIHLALGDSRSFLKRLAVDRSELRSQSLFFYLDAHWGADLPLHEEVEIVFEGWSRAVVMIDDFRVPGDEYYRYDDYGPGKQLCLEYLDRPHLATFFPALPGKDETGLRRGSVVLAMEPAIAEHLKQCETLTSYAAHEPTNPVEDFQHPER